MAAKKIRWTDEDLAKVSTTLNAGLAEGIFTLPRGHGKSMFSEIMLGIAPKPSDFEIVPDFVKGFGGQDIEKISPADLLRLSRIAISEWSKTRAELDRTTNRVSNLNAQVTDLTTERDQLRFKLETYTGPTTIQSEEEDENAE